MNVLIFKLKGIFWWYSCIYTVLDSTSLHIANKWFDNHFMKFISLAFVLFMRNSWLFLVSIVCSVVPTRYPWFCVRIKECFVPIWNFFAWGICEHVFFLLFLCYICVFHKKNFEYMATFNRRLVNWKALFDCGQYLSTILHSLWLSRWLPKNQNSII